jgi:hypothetical protein
MSGNCGSQVRWAIYDKPSDILKSEWSSPIPDFLKELCQALSLRFGETQKLNTKSIRHGSNHLRAH